MSQSTSFCQSTLSLTFVPRRATSCSPDPIPFTASPIECGHIKKLIITYHTSTPGRSEVVCCGLAQLMIHLVSGSFVFAVHVIGNSSGWIRLPIHSRRSCEFCVGTILSSLTGHNLLICFGVLGYSSFSFSPPCFAISNCLLALEKRLGLNPSL